MLSDIKTKIFSLLTKYKLFNQYFLSITIIAIAILLCTPLSDAKNYYIVSFILILVVSMMATFMEVGPILLAATIGSLGWNFFFIPPHLTLHIDKTEDILMFGIFLVIALLNGILTSRVHKQERLTRSREQRTKALFQLTSELSKASELKDVIEVSKEEIKNYFSIEATFFLQKDEKILSTQTFSNNDASIHNESNIFIDSVYKKIKKSKVFLELLPDNGYKYFPLTGIHLKNVYLIILNSDAKKIEKSELWATYLTLIGNALEREILKEIAKESRFIEESERLYKTLFNSLSHELRIPVATIVGASDALVSSNLPANIQSTLSNEILTASVRLNRLIENLLNMSRLENERFSIRLDWHDLHDLVNKVIDELRDELKPFNFISNIPEDLPLIKIDFGLMQQVLYNLLYNACQHAPGTSNIRLNATYSDQHLEIQILDRGPGFPDEQINSIFNKFFRVDNSKTGGLGLGLSIVKGFIEAHKGTVTAENRENGGAKFTIRIPSPNPEMNFLP
ncbi:MAG: ATP-binding protein [Bacteroidales bacterium]